MKKQYIIIIAIIILIIGSLSIFFITKNLKEDKNNNDDSNGALVDNPKVPEESEYDFEIKMDNQGILENLIIRNYMVSGVQQGSTIEFELVNKTDKELNIETVNLTFYDNTNTAISTVPVVVLPVKAKERKKVVLNNSKDLKFAVKYTVDIVYK